MPSWPPRKQERTGTQNDTKPWKKTRVTARYTSNSVGGGKTRLLNNKNVDEVGVHFAERKTLGL